MCKKLVLALLLLSLSACAPSIKTSRVSLEESDKLASRVTDEWVKTDTENAIADLLNKIDNSKPFQRYLTQLGRQPRLFIGEVQNGTSEPYLPIADMNERLLIAMFDRGDFKIIDKEARSAILKEITYQNDGMVDPAQAKKIGRQSGADIAIFGAIHMHPKTLSGRTIKEYSVNFRITDLETSDVVFMGSYDLQKYSVRSGSKW